MKLSHSQLVLAQNLFINENELMSSNKSYNNNYVKSTGAIPIVDWLISELFSVGRLFCRTVLTKLQKQEKREHVARAVHVGKRIHLTTAVDLRLSHASTVVWRTLPRQPVTNEISVVPCRLFNWHYECRSSHHFRSFTINCRWSPPSSERQLGMGTAPRRRGPQLELLTVRGEIKGTTSAVTWEHGTHEVRWIAMIRLW